MQELSSAGESFTPSDVERALWSAAVGAKLMVSPNQSDGKSSSGRKRKRKF